MNDDDLLRALGALARERDAAPPDVWARLARGELPAAELAELEAGAAADEALSLSLRAHRPLSGEARERIVDALSAVLPAPTIGAPNVPAAEQRSPSTARPLPPTPDVLSPGVSPPSFEATTNGAPPSSDVLPSNGAPPSSSDVLPSSEAVAPSHEAPSSEAAASNAAAPSSRGAASNAAAPSSPGAPSNVTSLDSRRRRFALVASPLVAAFAAAAALWLFVINPPAGPDLAPLPSYELEARGGVKTTRGPDEPATATLRLAPGSEVDLVLRPTTRAEGPLGARAFGVQGATVRPWSVPLEVAPTGAMRLRGPTDSLVAGFTGEFELRVLVGRTEAFGSDVDVREKVLGREGAGRGWQVLRVPVELVPTR